MGRITYRPRKKDFRPVVLNPRIFHPIGIMQDISPDAGQESAFTFDELFFSRTDENGIILAGNDVFQRVSCYGWDELLNKPHKIIRHPDTPRAVFWLLWDAIKKNEPIGAYVKNRAKDGSSYWVYAVVTPIEGGYLSVRLKPGSALLATVKREYAILASAEKRDGLKPADAAKILLDRLGELGFQNYGAFMSIALASELRARDEQLKRMHLRASDLFAELLQSAQSLLGKTAEISAAYDKNQYVPLNLQVQAARLGQFGATIAIISDNYCVISDEIRRNLKQFIASAEQVEKTILDGQFLAATATIQEEILAIFRREARESKNANEREIELLDAQSHAYNEKALAGFHMIAEQAARFRQDCMEMSRLAAGLEVTRIMGKVESARLSDAGQGLNELTDELEMFQKSVTAGLKGISSMNRRIEQATHDLTDLARQAA